MYNILYIINIVYDFPSNYTYALFFCFNKTLWITLHVTVINKCSVVLFHNSESERHRDIESN